jgi:hypothetical protein
MKKPAKIGLWLFSLAVLGVLGLWLEHEQAKARLAAFKADLIAKGEKLAIADHVPKLPPALSNAAPDFIAAANRLTEFKAEWQPSRMRMVAPGKARVTWRQPELPSEKEPDLWPFIIAHVEENRPLLAEMATALEKPEMVFNLDYTKGFNLLLPHLVKHKVAVNALANAMLVDLRAEQPASAHTNLLTAVRVVRRNEEPLLISHYVRVAVGHLAIGATWEALQVPGWSDGQLHSLQTDWQSWDTKRGWLAAMNMERAIGLETFAQCRGNPDMMRVLDALGAASGSGSPTGASFFHDLFNDPKRAGERALALGVAIGWTLWFSYDDEQWTLNQYQAWLDGARATAKADALELAFTRMAAESKRWENPPKTLILSRMVLPALMNAHKKFAHFEALRRLTVTAIALHRHKLKHGQFPESLGALVPEFLAEVPRDFMDGQPLRYRREPDGQFRLWSVSEDFKDDGGDATTVGAQNTNPFDWLKGKDWVWPQPASEAEVAAFHAELEAKRAAAPPKP